MTNCLRLCGFCCDFVDALDFSAGYGFLNEVGCGPCSLLEQIETSVFWATVEANELSAIYYSFLNQSVNALAVSLNVVGSLACFQTASAGAAAARPAGTQSGALGWQARGSCFAS